MTLQTGEDPMVSHPLSSVYGMYVIEMNGEAQLCTADPEFLFEQLEGVSFKDADKVKVILLSSEEWARDDITAFVWEKMAGRYSKMPITCQTVEEWDECVGIDIGFIRAGFGEHEPHAERARRKAERCAMEARLAKFSHPAVTPMKMVG